VANLEKKNDAFNVYFNYAASFRAEQNGDKEWSTAFTNKQLRLEIKGNIGDHLYYRFRHRLNKGTDARGDNFAKATDIMMAGWKFNDKLSIQAGKMCQIWGGFEFDENPMYIYQYSDMVDYMDNFMAGLVVSYKPIPSQELAFEVSDANNDNLNMVYGVGSNAWEQGGTRPLEQSKNPLTYIANWNGSFANGMINTRWSWGLQTQARHKYSRMLVLGQQLNLAKFQWYVDYMGAWDGLDRLGIATGDMGHVLGANVYASDVHYNSFISKVNWQFAPQWNLMLKGMYETANVTSDENFKNYRRSISYGGFVEYIPDTQLNLHLFLGYMGKTLDYTRRSALTDIHTNRIELGFMSKLKLY